MTEASVVTLQWLVGIQPGYKGVMRSEKPQGHAGEGETARMLVTAPHLVRMDEARSYHPAIPPDPAPNDKMPYLGGAIGRYKYPPAVFGNSTTAFGAIRRTRPRQLAKSLCAHHRLAVHGDPQRVANLESNDLKPKAWSALAYGLRRFTATGRA